MNQNDNVIDTAQTGELSAGAPIPEILYRQLRSEILNGLLIPGQLLRQEVLARRFNVSRVPLREAMSRLEAEGFVKLRPRRGYAVVSLDQSDIVEIFELRATIEAHAGTIAARARTDSEVSAIGELLDRMKNLGQKRPDCHDEWSQLNYEFHEQLINSAHRPRLSRIAGTLRDNVEPYIRMELRLTGDVDEADEEHQEIFAALKTGDSHGLADLCRAHVEHTAKRLLKGLRRSQLEKL